LSQDLFQCALICFVLTIVFATRLSLSERKPLALVLEKFQKTEQAAFLDPCGQTFSSLLQASDFLIGNKK